MEPSLISALCCAWADPFECPSWRETPRTEALWPTVPQHTLQAQAQAQAQVEVEGEVITHSVHEMGRPLGVSSASLDEVFRPPGRLLTAALILRVQDVGQSALPPRESN